jgi:NitT/TauT family transport system permease protein
MTGYTATFDRASTQTGGILASSPKSNWRGRLTALALGLLSASVWLAQAAITDFLPDQGDFGRAHEFAAASAAFAMAIAAAGLAGLWHEATARKVRHFAPWFITSGIFLAAWETLSSKTGVLPLPFFPPPHGLLEVYTDDYPRLTESVLASLRLELLGFAFGASAGFLIGVGLGWSRAFGYWAHPVMRFIGPLPSIAWLPIAFFVFPSSFSASIFLIGLTTGFPVAVLTWSGVASVNSAYYDVARTLGASPRFLILKVAIPAALPHVFVGLFMGLGASFAVLVTAEMMGVKAGLGFYLQWAQGWGAYANMYAALVLMALMCSGLITLLFKVRSHVLSYQKEEVKW